MFNLKGQRFLRLEMRVDGTVEGWAVKQGARTEYFNDAPDFVRAVRQPARASRASGAIAARAGTVSLFVPLNGLTGTASCG